MIWIILGMIAVASAAYGIRYLVRAWRWVRGSMDAIGRAEEGDGW